MANNNSYSPNVLKAYSVLSPHYSADEMKQLGEIFMSGALEQRLKKLMDLEDRYPSCPNCNNLRIVKYGKANGKQRYYCNDCHRTFVEGGQSMLGYTKENLVVWKKFIVSMLRRPLSVSQLSEICEISQPTAFNMRLRLFYAAEQLNQSIKLSGEIEADETPFSFSAKGQDFTDVHRKPRRRGGGNTIKNHQKNEIYVMVAIERAQVGDNKFKIASGITGFGTSSSSRVWTFLREKIEPTNGTILITDGAKNFSLTVKRLGIAWDRLPSSRRGKKKVPTINGRHSIQLVNNMHSRLKERFSHSASVSSKYLKGYLQVFDFTINYSSLSVEEQAELILKTLLTQETHLTIPELKNRYILPKYKDQMAAEWKKYFTKKEIRLYGEIKRGAVKKKLIDKYGTTYKRMRTLVRKIEELKIEEEVLRASLIPDHKQAICQKSWDIYVLYQTGKYTQDEIADMYQCTSQNIQKIIRRINGRPEGFKRNKPLTKAERKAMQSKDRFNAKKQKTKEFHQEIYDAFNVLCAGRSGISLTKAYLILGKKFNLSVNTIRNVVFELRKADKNAIWRRKGTKVAVDFDHDFKPPEP